MSENCKYSENVVGNLGIRDHIALTLLSHVYARVNYSYMEEENIKYQVQNAFKAADIFLEES